MTRAASSKTEGPKTESSRRAPAAGKGAVGSSAAKPKPTTAVAGSTARSRAGRSQTPIETSKDANVLASGKRASSPSSPSSAAAASSGRGQRRSSDGCLRAAAGGSGRALALRCARRPRASADDGRTDASGGDSELRMAWTESTPKPTSRSDAPASSDTGRTPRKRVLHPAQDGSASSGADAPASSATECTTRKRVLAPARGDCEKVDDLPPKAAPSLGAPTRSKTQLNKGAEERSTVSHPDASRFVEQVPHHDLVEARSLKGATATVLGEVRAAENRVVPKRCVGIDLGRKLSFCEVQGDEVVQRAMLTTKSELERVLGPATEPARVAIEACREAWYYHDLLKSWGHQVLVVDTTRVRELGIGHGRRKNDRIDAEVLARAVQSGRIPLAHVLSPERREMRAEIGVRRALVQTRAEFVVTVRGLLRSWGVQAPKCEPGDFALNVDKLVRAKQLTKDRYARIEPLIAVLNSIGPQIRALDSKLERMIEGVEIGKVLMTCPGVGTVVACSFVSVIDDASRFDNAHQVEAYLGLVPSENTSGARKLGSITKAGNTYLRAMLVQAAWVVLRCRVNSALKLWGMAIAKKKGKKLAVVAIARRLAGILWAMWRDNKPYDPSLVGKASSQGLREQAQRVDNVARAVEATA